jgi:hypothetical protein
VRRLLPLALVALAACIDDLAPQYRVTDLRVLAVRAQVLPQTGPATMADPLPGDTLRLEALVANPLARAPLTVTWYACWPTGTDAVPACVDERYLRDPAALPRAAADPASGVVALGAGESVSVPIPAASDPRVAAAVALLVRRVVDQPTWACALYAELPVVAVVEANGRRELAVKRVRLAADPAMVAAALEAAGIEASRASVLAGAYVRNENPGVFGVGTGASEEACAGDATTAAPASFPPERTTVCGAVSAGAQAYNATCDGATGVPVATAVESLSWQWYVTAGEFPDAGGIGNETESAPELDRTPGPFTLWVLLRDGRGGVDWSTVAVDALPAGAGYPPDGIALPAPEPMSVFRSSSVK